MALLLPGERPRPILEALLAIAAVVGLCALGCATSTRSDGLRSAQPSSVHAAARPPDDTRLVEQALRRRGLRFGTDGSARALWGYLRHSHEVVRAAEARAGDIVFFDTTAAGDCADRVGIVDRVDGDGRISFIEARRGHIQRGFADPAHPALRRNARGEIANSFLRPKTVSDPPDARYFAGEMLCGVARVASP